MSLSSSSSTVHGFTTPPVSGGNVNHPRLKPHSSSSTNNIGNNNHKNSSKSHDPSTSLPVTTSLAEGETRKTSPKSKKKHPTKFRVQTKQPGTSQDSTPPPQKNNNNKIKNNNDNNSNNDKQQRWLYWLYRQWHDSPVGQVKTSVLQQFLPAAQAWKSKRTRLGSQRTTELVERYCLEYLVAGSSAGATGHGHHYLEKLLRTGWEGWWQLWSSNSNNNNNTELLSPMEAATHANELLDGIVVTANRFLDNDVNNNDMIGKSEILRRLVDKQRLQLQTKMKEKGLSGMDSAAENTSSNNASLNSVTFEEELSELLHAAIDVHTNDQHIQSRRKLDDSLMAMQRTVLLLDKALGVPSSNNNQQNDNGDDMPRTRLLEDVIDVFERELVFTMSEQEQFLHNSAWLGVALPFWEFLHHSLVRALVDTNQPERAQRALDSMQDTRLRCVPGSHHSTVNGQKDSMIPILSMQWEGNELVQRIQNDKEHQWLQWLSHQMEVTPVGELSESILNLMVSVISDRARWKTKKNAAQAEALLQRYVKEFRAGNACAVLDNTLFNRVCDAWAKLGKPERAQRVLNQMVELRQEQQQQDPKRASSLRADVISLSTLAAAWANSRDPLAAKRAEAILERMEAENLKPTTITYNTVLRALVHSPELHKALRAEEIIQRMELRFEAGHTECQPSIRTYQSLISAWSRTDLAGTPQKAEQVLDMLDGKAKSGFNDLEPNAHCFAAAIHAWAYSLEEQKARRACAILSHMKYRYESQGKKECQPNVVVYTSVINACASPALESEKEESFLIAERALKELEQNQRQYGFPNFLTYAAFFRVCATTLEPGAARDKIVRSMFTACCEAGQVGDVVLHKLKLAASNDLYQELVGSYQQSKKSWRLPQSWTRRLQGDASTRRPRKKSNASPRRNHKNNKTRSSSASLKEVQELRGKTGRFSS